MRSGRARLGGIRSVRGKPKDCVLPRMGPFKAYSPTNVATILKRSVITISFAANFVRSIVGTLIHRSPPAAPSSRMRKM